MSRRRLIVSLATIACCLALAATLAAKAFPLQGSPLAAQSAPAGGVANGVPGGVTGGVVQGVSGGVAGGIKQGVGGGGNQIAPQRLPTVESSDVWFDTVKQGPMIRQVRGLGTLVRGEDSANLVARVMLPESIAPEVKLNQNAVVDTHNGLVKGHVTRISPSPSNGTRTVDIALDEALPSGAGDGLQVDGTIEIEKLDNVVYVGRPAYGFENTSTSLFKLVHDGKEAVRVNVRLGRASVQTIEVLEGLKVGDKVILSDMSRWETFDRILIK